MKSYDYTGDKVKNQFTAYLREFIRSKRWRYLTELESRRKMEKPLNSNLQIKYIVIDELLEAKRKESLLFKERQGFYPEWSKLSDQKLVRTLMLLNEEERHFIYQHVFEEMTFDEMSRLNNLSPNKVKDIYYYAIRKIRKWMGGE